MKKIDHSAESKDLIFQNDVIEALSFKDLFDAAEWIE